MPGIKKIVEDAFDCDIRIGFRFLVNIRTLIYNAFQTKMGFSKIQNSAI